MDWKMTARFKGFIRKTGMDSVIRATYQNYRFDESKTWKKYIETVSVADAVRCMIDVSKLPEKHIITPAYMNKLHNGWMGVICGDSGDKQELSHEGNTKRRYAVCFDPSKDYTKRCICLNCAYFNGGVKATPFGNRIDGHCIVANNTINEVVFSCSEYDVRQQDDMRPRKQESPEPTPPEPASSPVMKTDVTNTITFMDFKTTDSRTTKLSTNEISIQKESSGMAMSINEEVSKKILSKGFDRMSLAMNNLTGEVFFVFAKEGNLNVRIGKGKKNATICNKAMSKYLLEKFGNLDPKNAHVVRVSGNLSKKEDCFTVKIESIKQK